MQPIHDTAYTAPPAELTAAELEAAFKRAASLVGSPSLSARIKKPARTIELGCSLRYCLLTATDQLILMFQRRVAD